MTRRRRNSLSRQEIADAALAELAERGFAGLTVRSVAARMEAAPMSLYNHVRSRDEIIDLATDAVLARLDLDLDRHEPIVQLALRHLTLLRRHPWAIPALLARPYPGEAAARIGETYLEAAARAGAPPAVQAKALMGVLALVYGTAGFVVPRADAQAAGEVAERIRSVDEAAFPRSAAAAADLGGYGDPAVFAETVRALLRGLGVRP